MLICPVKVGSRVNFLGRTYEVTFCGNGNVRLSDTHGGRVKILSYEDIQKLLTSDPASGESPRLKLEYNSTLNIRDAKEGQAILRKYRYVEHALKTLEHPTASGPLRRVIEYISIEIADSNSPAISTVSKWIRRYQIDNIPGLYASNKKGNRTKRFCALVEDIVSTTIKNLVQDTQEIISADYVHAAIVGELMELSLCDNHESKLRIPSLRTIQRRIKKLDPYLIIKAKEGVVAASNSVRASGTKIISIAPLSRVETDSHYLDILVVDPESGELLGRPWITLMICTYTKIVVGSYVSLNPPTSLSSLGALRDMISRPERGLPGGIPCELVPDNGSEYENSGFDAACEYLGINKLDSQAGYPDDKPGVEAFNKRLTLGAIQIMPGTTRSNPEKRSGYNSKKKAVMSLAQVRTFTAQWLETIYNFDVHSGTGRVPILHWKEATKVIKPAYFSIAEAEMLLRRPEKCRINNGRILHDYIYYSSHSLATLETQGFSEVTVLIDDLDLNVVYVKHPSIKNELIQAYSTDPSYTQDLTRAVHIEAKRIRKEQTESDIIEIGRYTLLLAKHRFLKDIHREALQSKSNLARIKKIKKLNKKSVAIPKIIERDSTEYESSIIHRENQNQTQLIISDDFEVLTRTNKK